MHGHGSLAGHATGLEAGGLRKHSAHHSLPVSTIDQARPPLCTLSCGCGHRGQSSLQFAEDIGRE